MAVTLEVDLQVDGADEAATKVERAGDAFAQLAQDVKEADAKIGAGVGGLDRAAESSDELASKSGQATGALGALSSGFELVGAEKYATGLQSAALATDFLSGVGDAANLVTQSSIVLKAKDTASTIAQTVAEKARAVATKATTAAQWLLNAATSANPIGLIIAAVIGLVALFVVLYKRSETFRGIVKKVGDAGKAALGAIVKFASNLVGWVKEKLPAAWEFLKRITVAYFRAVTTPYRLLMTGLGKLVDLVKSKAPAAWNALKSAAVSVFKIITAPVRTIIDLFGDIVEFVKVKIPAGFRALREAAGNILDKVLAPFEKIRDVIEDIIDFISDIDLPDIDLPDIPGLRTAAGPANTISGAGAGETNVTVILPDVVDPESSGRAIERVVSRRDWRRGRRVPRRSLTGII